MRLACCAHCRCELMPPLEWWQSEWLMLLGPPEDGMPVAVAGGAADDPEVRVSALVAGVDEAMELCGV